MISFSLLSQQCEERLVQCASDLDTILEAPLPVEIQRETTERGEEEEDDGKKGVKYCTEIVSLCDHNNYVTWC